MMSQKEQLLSDLRRIAENKYDLNRGEGVSQYVDKMLQNIGDPDPELRDDLIYNTFCEWICEKEYFSEEDLRHILGILMDENHLFYKIGNDGDETVFTRTFSILAMVLIISQHRKKHFLDYNGLIQVKNAIIKYYGEEKDFRGYIDEYGWAHGAAHGADALDELVQCEESNEEIFREILDSMKKVLYNEKYLLCNEEDERMARVVYRMVKRNSLAYRTINNWIDGLNQCCVWERTRKQYIARVNTKNFVRCLYFKLVHNQVAPDIRNTLLNSEGSLNRFLQIDKDI